MDILTKHSRANIFMDNSFCIEIWRSPQRSSSSVASNLPFSRLSLERERKNSSANFSRFQEAKKKIRKWANFIPSNRFPGNTYTYNTCLLHKEYLLLQILPRSIGQNSPPAGKKLLVEKRSIRGWLAE